MPSKKRTGRKKAADESTHMAPRDKGIPMWTLAEHKIQVDAPRLSDPLDILGYLMENGLSAKAAVFSVLRAGLLTEEEIPEEVRAQIRDET